jgi:hypothetical protein
LILTYMMYMINCWKKIASPKITRTYASYAIVSPAAARTVVQPHVCTTHW